MGLTFRCISIFLIISMTILFSSVSISERRELSAIGEGSITFKGGGDLTIYGKGDLKLISSSNIKKVSYIKSDGTEEDITTTELTKKFNFNGTIKITGDDYEMSFNGKCMNLKFSGSGDFVFTGEGIYDISGISGVWDMSGISVGI